MPKKLVLLFVLAFVLRIFLINVAFHGDLYNNLSWGQGVLTHGLNGIYEVKEWSHSIPNQPPLYLLLFGFTSFLYQVISSFTAYLNSHIGFFPSAFVWFWQTNGNIILLKLPGIFADLGIAAMIYKIIELKVKSDKLKIAFFCSSLWLFNPIGWYNSAIWGQTDSIVNLLGLLSIYFLLKKKLLPSMLYIVLSILFKGSLIIFLPIIVLFWFYQKYSFKIWIRSILYTIFCMLLVSVWFHPNLNLPIWLFNLYTKQILPGEIGDLSANAFNFWYLVNPGKVLDSIIYFGLPARIWGYILTIIPMGIIVVKLRQSKTEKKLFFALAVVALTSFLFMTRIHERYLYPFFPIAIILIGYIPKFIIPYIVLSFVYLLNMYNLFWAPGIPVLENILKTTQLPIILAVVNLIVFVWVFAWDISKD